MSHTQSRCRFVALASLLGVGACSGTVDPPPERAANLVVRAALSATAVVAVVVEVTAPDFPTPLVFNIPIVNRVATGTITLQAGSDRTITMRAYDAGGVETHRGAVTLDVHGGANPTISLVLMPLTGDVPIDVTLGSFSVTVTPAANSITIEESAQLTAVIKDWHGNPTTGTVAWATSDPAIASVDASGLARGTRTGSTTISATFNGATGTATVTVEPITGLDFPGNDAVATTMRFEFTSPMAAYPATYIWRAYPRQQTGYYTAFFHANNSSDFNNQLQYYGFHPYPEPPPPLMGTPKWEISVDGGADITGDPVVFGRRYLQVAVVFQEGPSAYRHTYYWDWPDTTHKIVWVGSAYAPAPNPAIMVGDNPWNPGEEVWNGVLRGFQFYNAALTPSQIVQEIAAPGSFRTPWYLNLNPTPTDIADQSGNGHHPAWVGTERPTLWTGTGP